MAPDTVDIHCPCAGEGLQAIMISWPLLASSCLCPISPVLLVLWQLCLHAPRMQTLLLLKVQPYSPACPLLLSLEFPAITHQYGGSQLGLGRSWAASALQERKCPACSRDERLLLGEHHETQDPIDLSSSVTTHCIRPSVPLVCCDLGFPPFL